MQKKKRTMGKIPRTPVTGDDDDRAHFYLYRVTTLLEELEMPTKGAGLFEIDLVGEMLSVLEEFGEGPFTDQQAIKGMEESVASRVRSENEIREATAIRDHLWAYFKHRAARVRGTEELVSKESGPVFQLYERHYWRQLLLDLLLVGAIRPAGQDEQGNHLYVYRRGATS